MPRPTASVGVVHNLSDRHHHPLDSYPDSATDPEGHGQVFVATAVRAFRNQKARPQRQAPENESPTSPKLRQLHRQQAFKHL
jgi:hypothetical protein